MRDPDAYRLLVEAIDAIQRGDVAKLDHVKKQAQVEFLRAVNELNELTIAVEDRGFYSVPD